MDISGQIHRSLDEEQIDDPTMTEVSEEDMTEKQKQTNKVSVHDHRSVLGQRLGKIRNQPCPCGSGIKTKRCCGRNK